MMTSKVSLPTGQPSADEGALLLREYVYRALISKGKGSDVKAFNDFVKQLVTLRKKLQQSPNDQATIVTLTSLIQALTDSVSALKERKHDSLLGEVLGIPLWTCHESVRASVLDLVSHLVVANSAFTHTCLQVVVYSLLPPPTPPTPGSEADTDAAAAAAGLAWQPGSQALTVQNSVLVALDKVLQLVPTAPTALLQLVQQHMPHKLRDRNTQCLYLTACFKVAEADSGAPIREGLLAAVVEHLLSLDVEIRWEDIVDVPTGDEAEEEGESEDEDAEQQLEDIFELEGMSELDLQDHGAAGAGGGPSRPMSGAVKGSAAPAAGRGGWEGAAAGPPPPAAVASTSGRPPVDETANKLDSMMELVMAHLERRIQAGALDQVWDTLMTAFERSVLNTHRSKFTQFLVFYAAMKRPDPLSRSFVQLLLSRLGDARQPPITRSACCAYLASYLARAAFVPEDLVVSSLMQLTEFATSYARGVGALGGSAPDLSSSSSASNMTNKHQVFYASIQAILYVLCYHLEPLVNAAQAGKGLQQRLAASPSLGAPLGSSAGAGGVVMGSSPATVQRAAQQAQALGRMVRERLWPLLTCKLSPLAVCLPSVVSEFKAQAAGLGLLDLSKLVPQDEMLQRAQRPLEMLFPFDPFLLKRSSRFLELRSSYVRWRHGRPRGGQGRLLQAAAGEDGAVGEEDEEEGSGTDSEPAAAEDLDLDEDDDSDDDDDDELVGGTPPDTLFAPQHRHTLPGAAIPQAAPFLLPPRPRATHPHLVPHGHQGSGGHRRHGPGASKAIRAPGQAARVDDMAMSYQSAGTESMGDATPPYGTSPVLVHYPAGSMGTEGNSPSPMQMTPPIYHMEAVPSRLRMGH